MIYIYISIFILIKKKKAKRALLRHLLYLATVHNSAHDDAKAGSTFLSPKILLKKIGTLSHFKKIQYTYFFNKF